jgi:hypothetical protein
MTADWTENTKALKLLIIVMTTLLIGGLILLMVGMARTAGEMSETVGDIEIALPADAEIVSMNVNDGRIYALVKLSDGNRSVLVYETTTGRALGQIGIVTTP